MLHFKNFIVLTTITRNIFSNPNLEGSIPQSIGNLTKLRHLYVVIKFDF